MATGRALPSGFESRAAQLLENAVTEGDRMRWPLGHSEPNSWPGWCHGSAGYTFLWTALYKLSGNDKYIEVAEKAALHFRNDRTGTNGSLCCGLSGQAYALLNLYKITSSPVWLKSAKGLRDRILKNIHDPSMRPNSLYKGDIGAGLLMTEIGRPELARMPLFE
jgi:serine/threonine-protein kinase